MVSHETIKQVDSRAVSIEVTELGPMPIRRPYTMHDTGFLVPSRVDIRWEDGELVKLIVAGTKLRKDGTIGMQDGSTHFVYYGKAIQDRPGWLQELVEEYRP